MKKRILIFDCDTISIEELVTYLKKKVNLQLLKPKIVSNRISFKRAIAKQQWDIIIVNFCLCYLSSLDRKKIQLFVADLKKRQPNTSYFLGVVANTYQRDCLVNLDFLVVHKSYNEPLIDEAFGLIKINPDKRVSIETIKAVVSERYDVPCVKLEEKTRKRPIVKARQITMFLCKMFTKNSLKTIGKHFGGRDHTTVMHSHQTVIDLMDTDEDFKAEVNELIKIIVIAA